jgi:hypothetical protein
MTPFIKFRQAPLSTLRGPQPAGNASRRPHEAGALDAVRGLVETTTLSFREIGRRTGVSAATVSRQARRGAWTRPDAGFPVEHYTAEGRRTLRRSAIAERLVAQAEHLLFQTEMNPTAARRRLEQVMRLVRAARQLDADEREARGRGTSTRRKRG